MLNFTTKKTELIEQKETITKIITNLEHVKAFWEEEQSQALLLGEIKPSQNLLLKLHQAFTLFSGENKLPELQGYLKRDTDISMPWNELKCFGNDILTDSNFVEKHMKSITEFISDDIKPLIEDLKKLDKSLTDGIKMIEDNKNLYEEIVTAINKFNQFKAMKDACLATFDSLTSDKKGSKAIEAAKYVVCYSQMIAYYDERLNDENKKGIEKISGSYRYFENKSLKEPILINLDLKKFLSVGSKSNLHNFEEYRDQYKEADNEDDRYAVLTLMSKAIEKEFALQKDKFTQLEEVSNKAELNRFFIDPLTDKKRHERYSNLQNLAQAFYKQYATPRIKNLLEIEYNFDDLAGRIAMLNAISQIGELEKRLINRVVTNNWPIARTVIEHIPDTAMRFERYMQTIQILPLFENLKNQDFSTKLDVINEKEDENSIKYQIIDKLISELGGKINANQTNDKMPLQKKWDVLIKLITDLKSYYEQNVARLNSFDMITSYFIITANLAFGIRLIGQLCKTIETDNLTKNAINADGKLQKVLKSNSDFLHKARKIRGNLAHSAKDLDMEELKKHTKYIIEEGQALISKMTMGCQSESETAENREPCQPS